MPMAPHSFPILGLLRLVAVFVAFAVSARASAANNKPAAADSVFLRACCANTTNASACYDSLLPSAASFYGNRIRVAYAAGAVAFARLRRFHADLRRLQPGGTGAGRVADMALESCVSFAAVLLDREGDTLANLQRLETAAGRRRGEHAEFDLSSANIGIGTVGSCATSCIDDLASTGDAALASPVGKKVAAWVASVNIYANIALDLVNSIKL